jgi:hypothetical protein
MTPEEEDIVTVGLYILHRKEQNLYVGNIDGAFIHCDIHMPFITWVVHKRPLFDEGS